MDRSADLDRALEFVIGRIEQEATRSGEPLGNEQRFLLNHLPNDSVLPQAYGGAPEFPAVLVPRDLAYERLCTLAKAAHHNDLRVNPASALDWEFATSVTKLNGHPMSWLLQWAGLKVHRPWWDRPLLVGASLLFTLFLMALMLFGEIETGTRVRWVVVGVGYIVMLLLVFFASRHIEEWQLKQIIEKCRRAFPG
jgi:hypothetical protein